MMYATTRQPTAILFGLLLFGLLPAFAMGSEAPQRPRVVFINPASADTEFFIDLIDIMRAAAKNLGIQLEVVHGERNPVMTREFGEAFIYAARKPDYLVLVNDRDVVPALMKDADAMGVPTVVFLDRLAADVERQFRDGDGALAHWIGTVAPDEEEAGYLVARLLIEQARSRDLFGEDQKIHVVGVNGIHRSYTAVQRELGLRRYIAEHPDTVLHRVVPAHWSPEKAQFAVEQMLEIYPEISVIWSAADAMALGAAKGLENLGRKPGRDTLTCGIDWIPDIYEALSDGTLSCTVGGHIFDGAWLMVLLLDHFNGKIDNRIDVQTLHSEIGPDGVGTLRELFENKSWHGLDFTQYSAALGNVPPSVYGSHLILQR